MTTATIRPTSTSNDGALRSSNANYALAQAGPPGNIFLNGVNLTGGQRLNGSTHEINQIFLEFPCGSIPTNGVASSAVIEITSAGFFNAPNLVFYLYDHGSSLVFGDWVTNYASLTEVATITAPTSAQTFQVTLDADGLAAVNAAIAAGGTVGFMWVSANVVAGSAPSGDERYQHAASENGTAASRPALIVEYDIPAPIPVFDHHYRMMRAAA